VASHPDLLHTPCITRERLQKIFLPAIFLPAFGLVADGAAERWLLGGDD